MSKTLQLTCYLVIPYSGRSLLTPRVLKTKPDLARNEIAVWLRLQVPESTFHNLIPGAELRIPESMTLQPEVDLEVVEPEEEAPDA